MNRIVRTQTTAAELPPRLREGIAPHAKVEVTVQEIERRPTREEQIALLAAAKTRPASEDDPVARIRALRDEWDD